MKELELLDKVAHPIRRSDGKIIGGLLGVNWEAYELLKESLTPPTADDICKALGEYLCEKIGKKLEVEYLNGDFILQNNYIAFLDGKGSLCFNFNLPPRLIKMVASFYAKEVKGE